MSEWLARNRVVIYVMTNLTLLIAAAIGSGSQDGAAGPVVYVAVLFALCSVPILWLARLNDRYMLLAMFMGVYFLFFGALSLQAIFVGGKPAPDEFMTPAQFGAILGAALVLVGYRLGAHAAGPPKAHSSGADWSNSAVLVVGLACWGLGSAAIAYYSLYVTTESSNAATERGFAMMGPLLTFVVMLGHLVQPLGLVILAYGYAKTRGPFWLTVVVAVALLQVVLGFVTDAKGTALLGCLLVALTKTLWDNKLPRGWIAAVVAFLIFAFPVFQAYRAEIRGERGLDRHQALEMFTKVLEISWQARDKVANGRPGERAPTFIERSSNEEVVDLVFRHAGVDTPFLHGYTMKALPLTFVPRLLIPDKEDPPVGQLTNKVFMHGTSDDFTYISLSELGEFYWNFGWPGVIGGMLLTGVVLGFVGAKTNLAEQQSVTRLVLLLITIKQLCLGFGGSVSNSYVVWLRAVAAIGLLHLVFSRPQPQKAVASSSEASRNVEPHALPAPRFPNLLR